LPHKTSTFRTVISLINIRSYNKICRKICFQGPDTVQVSRYIRNYTTPHPRTPYTAYSQPWEPQISQNVYLYMCVLHFVPNSPSTVFNPTKAINGERARILMLLIMQFTRFPNYYWSSTRARSLTYGLCTNAPFVRRIVISKHTVTCIPIATQRLDKRVTIGDPLLGNLSTDTPP
jgi:hypothetical protein